MIIRYEENPNIKAKVVETVNGIKEYRTNCKFIKGAYYIKGVDCFEIENTWYRKTSGFISFDNETQEWFISKDRRHGRKEGIVGFTEEGTPIQGFFSSNPYNNCVAYINGGIPKWVINSDILLENGYIEDLSTGEWWLRREVGDNSFKKMTTIRKTKNYTNKGYNIEDNVDEFKEKIQLFENYNTPLSKDVRKFARLLGDVTFGIECETYQGNIPDRIQNRLGLVCCRDGSIGGLEAVSVPMKGAKGLQNVSNIGVALSKYCDSDVNCSYHIHIGNLNLSRAELVAMYMLCYNIQDDIFKMFPYYKTDPSGIKHKNYNKKLKKLGIYKLKDTSKEGFNVYVDEVYEKIFTFLSEGMPPCQDNNRKLHEHPVKNKWDRVNSRYFWVNFQNVLFSSRETTEFRVHQNTLNPIKMVNWLFMCVAIVRYGQANIKSIILGENNATMDDILDYYKNSFKRNGHAELLSGYLKAYYRERCDYFTKAYALGDKIGLNDLKIDKHYTFRYNNTTNLF